MSAYRRIETEFKDAEALREALEEVTRGRFEEGAGLNLYGYIGDKRPETAEFVIRRKFVEPSANDIGFHRTEDGSYQAIISEYDSGPGRRGSRMLGLIKQSYAKRQITRLARVKGFEVREVKANDGIVRLRLVGNVKRQRVGMHVG